MKLLLTFAIRKLQPRNAGGPVIELLVNPKGAMTWTVGLTREQAVALVGDLMQALEPAADAPDAGGIRAE